MVWCVDKRRNVAFVRHVRPYRRLQRFKRAEIEQGVSYKDYCKEIKDWLKKQLRNADPQTAKDLIKSEMAKVRKLSTYFDND